MAKTTLSSPNPIWERLPGEPDMAFEAWTAHLHTPTHERCLYETCVRFYPEYSHPKRKVHESIKTWSKRWKWPDRLSAWVDHQERVWQLECRESTQEAARRHVRNWAGLQQLGLLKIDQAMLRYKLDMRDLMNGVDDKGQPTEEGPLSFEEASRRIEIPFTIHQAMSMLRHGTSGEMSALAVNGLDVESLNRQQEQALDVERDALTQAIEGDEEMQGQIVDFFSKVAAKSKSG